jgi:hypothetical protein
MAAWQAESPLHDPLGGFGSGMPDSIFQSRNEPEIEN